MQLMKERDVPVAHNDRVYRSSRARAVIAYAGIVGAFSALFINGLRQHAPPFEIIAGMGIGAMFLARRFLTARFRPSNWLVRETESGLYVHFRSYLNYQMSADDPTVVFIPYREISRARPVRERREKPDLQYPNRMTVEILHIAELAVTFDTSALAAQLDAERGRPAPNERRWYGKTSVKYQDYPVSVNDTRVRIVWQCVPPLRAFLDALGRRHIPGDGEAQEAKSYEVTAAQNRADAEREIAELARSGRLESAVLKAAMVYRQDPAKAEQVIAALRRGEIPGEAAA